MTYNANRLWHNKLTVALQKRSLISFILFTLVLTSVFLTGTVYADPKVGPVLPENAILGSNYRDVIGNGGITVLPSGNIVIVSTWWNDKRGAVTCLTPAQYQTGNIIVSAANSLVGSKSEDYVGNGGIMVLTNGNYVVNSYLWDNDTQTDAGAVTWVNGSTCNPYGADSPEAVVSESNSLVGSTANDLIGGNGIIPLTNGHYVVRSGDWDNAGITNTGAATWGNGSTGIAGPVSVSNSLVGSSMHDQVGRNGILALSNGNYVVASGYWDNGGTVDVGAVTWGNGSVGIVGTINATNSLIGATFNNRVGVGGVMPLANGNYVVRSPEWGNGAMFNMGAVTWANGLGGTVGTVSVANSLIGSSSDDQIGYPDVKPLSNGNYIVRSPNWDNGAMWDAGAVTWGNGLGGTVGPVSATNSLVGSASFDGVGIGSLTVLTNGNYVVCSPFWDDGSTTNVGAVTWGSGVGPTVGTVSAANSLVGSTAEDKLGDVAISPLTNGNYVVRSPSWDNLAVVDAGAVTWGDGNGGTVGQITAVNSLVGSTVNDRIGGGITIALTNGNYVTRSSLWDNGAAVDAGAVTWGNGNGGTVGTVGAVNSLVGTASNSRVGNNAIIPLTNGNYVVRSNFWDDGPLTNVGAATWGNGLGGTVGPVSAANSLMGSTTNDEVGFNGIYALPNGHYVVLSRTWNNGGVAHAGAVTWGNGNGGTVGPVSVGNSLVGTTIDDSIGSSGILVFPNGNYLVRSIGWNNLAGAVTWGNGLGGTVGPVSATNSLIGATKDDLADVGDMFSLPNGHYLVAAVAWDAGATRNVGAVVWGNGDGSTVGPISVANALIGVTQNDALASSGITILPDSSYLVASHQWDNAGVEDVGVVVWSNGSLSPGNLAPVLAEIGNRTGYVGKPLSFTVSATDADLPAQTLTFSLEAGAPDGATIDPVSGLFSWPIDETVTPGDYSLTITVTDDDASPLSDSETITVTVLQDNFVNNYGFENPGATNKTAAGWNAVKTAKTDQRICNTTQKRVAFEGLCAYRFQLTGTAEPARAIQRKTNSIDFVKGDVLELRGMVKANNLQAGARLVLKAVYANKQQTVASLPLIAGTYGYQPVSVQLTLKRPPTKIVVQVKGGKAKGTFFVDDMAVVMATEPPSGEEVLQPPDASELRGMD